MSDANADRRTVATDALEVLGMCPLPKAIGRDAIHLAVEPVTAAERLLPGQDVGLINGRASFRAAKHIGIVDPFIKGPIEQGQEFLLVVYPRMITSLRHVWTHPDFEGEGEAMVPAAASKEASEAWLRDYISMADCPDFDTVVAAAIGLPVKQVDPVYGTAYEIQSYGDGDIYLYFGGRDAHGPIAAEFWDHIEIYTGEKVPPERRANHFSCSC